MKVKIQQGSEEINSIGGISLIGGMFKMLKSIKMADKMQTSKIKHRASSKPLPGCLHSAEMTMSMLLHSAKIRSFGTNAVPSEATLRQRIDCNLIRSGNFELLEKAAEFGFRL